MTSVLLDVQVASPAETVVRQSLDRLPPAALGSRADPAELDPLIAEIRAQHEQAPSDFTPQSTP